eukprot:TRINITY_DN11146_c0_g1_i2.p2 TRINITY_DN11146_c0_g1~~TRINITY_DN11146_c0_g1_i2.p2  ORF type:complete len:135 (-),score=11.62 TRINITY_DN11146_c0_g1_i2:325-729(-)
MCPGLVMDVEDCFRFTSCPKSCSGCSEHADCPLRSLGVKVRIRGTFLSFMEGREDEDAMRRYASSPALLGPILDKTLTLRAETITSTPPAELHSDQLRCGTRKRGFQCDGQDAEMIVTSGHRRRQRQREKKRNF